MRSEAASGRHWSGTGFFESARSGDPVRVVFLGGLGEIGRNMMAIEAAGRILVIDCGLSFPNEEMLGVDLVLPDFTWVVERADRVEAVLLTHGHEDHVGALSWFLQKVDVPVYGTPLTLGIAGRRLSEFGVKADIRAVGGSWNAQPGAVRLRFFTVSHSIPDTMAVVLDTPEGRIFYTGDFKLDPSPIDGRHTDLEGMAAMGHEGVDLMLSDSTNAETPGRTPSESIVGDALATCLRGRPGGSSSLASRPTFTGSNRSASCRKRTVGRSRSWAGRCLPTPMSDESSATFRLSGTRSWGSIRSSTFSRGR